MHDIIPTRQLCIVFEWICPTPQLLELCCLLTLSGLQLPLLLLSETLGTETSDVLFLMPSPCLSSIEPNGFPLSIYHCSQGFLNYKQSVILIRGCFNYMGDQHLFRARCRTCAWLCVALIRKMCNAIPVNSSMKLTIVLGDWKFNIR